MPTYPMMQIDAFTTEPLGGNPCAVIFDCDAMSTETMQQVAREMNLSETSFVMKSQFADFRARYFTPAEEIPLAGHPTIATSHALVASGRLPFAGGESSYMLELNVGPILVEIRGESAKTATFTMSQKKPEFLHKFEPEEVLDSFGLKEDQLREDCPVQVVSTGTPQLMIAVKSTDVLKKIQLDIPRYITLRTSSKFFSTHIFCTQGIENGHTFARHFVTPPDLIEDPFTGSATGGMGAFIWRYGLLNHNEFIAEQGHWMGRPGQAQVEVVGTPNAIETVKVGGPAVTVLQGELRI
ncbi:MAG: PhzF family phenazine biosynthesis protein [Calditrichaeota bacterium]|nr:MAG: PhzF family phenazine biosynthesis protein [Calditrichota bacterium]